MNSNVKEFIRHKMELRASVVGIDMEDLQNEELSLLESGIFDSLTFINLLSDLETEYSIELDLSDIEPEYFTSLQGLVALVENARDDQSAGRPSD